MKRAGMIMAIGGLAMALAGPGRVSPQTLGMSIDGREGLVLVFDAEADLLLGTVRLFDPLPYPRISLLDCSVTPDHRFGFVTDGQSHVWVIDLAAETPVLAAGTNPISISNSGVDTAITPDGRFLLVCGGLIPAPVSVIDLGTRQEIGTFPVAGGCNAVEVCDDRSVLVAALADHSVHRLVIDSEGALSDSGDSLVIADFPQLPGFPDLNFVNNVSCALRTRSDRPSRGRGP
jgi:hypothetical protein